MQKTVALMIALTLAAASPTSAQKSRLQATEEAPVNAKRSLFSGSKSRVAELGWLSPDCTASTPDVRLVKAPSHGELRFEEAKVTVSADKTALQKQCHGKSVDALRVYYKANSDYSGGDAFTIDVDTKLGFVKRYAFTMTIR